MVGTTSPGAAASCHPTVGLGTRPAPVCPLVYSPPSALDDKEVVLIRSHPRHRLSTTLVASAMLAAACGSSTPAASGSNTVSVGILHSLSGTMAISEVSVKDAEMLAIDEINAKGGVLGKQINPVVEDGASDWPTFAEKAQRLISVNKVAAVFGGWTSASRKAMLPVFERNHALLYYPVQYEGLESSPYIFY